jgi:hypothetical protein
MVRPLPSLKQPAKTEVFVRAAPYYGYVSACWVWGEKAHYFKIALMMKQCHHQKTINNND